MSVLLSYCAACKAILCCHLWPLWPCHISRIISQTGAILEKKGYCAKNARFDFLYNFCLKYCHFKENPARYYYKRTYIFISYNKTNQMYWFLKFIIGMKIYMFRAVRLSISRSFSLYTQQWYMSYRFVDNLRAGSGWNWVPSWSCS